MKFEPTDPAVINRLALQIHVLDQGLFEFFVVVDDCGPCITAGFVFEHDASFFAAKTGSAYVVDATGKPTEQ